jgi:2-polyprenyl-3-methyl-5-hydroxy-6-metoxy-1,4-benzoquinol methylase
VTGVDACPEAIEYARSIYGGTGIEYVCADACAMPFEDSSFDLAVSFETIEHIENDAGLVAELARVVRPGGTLICSTPNRWPLSIAPHHVREYDRSSFESVLGTHFQILEMWSQNSGSAFEFNHGQAKSIQPTTPGNELTAECFIAVCQRH